MSTEQTFQQFAEKLAGRIKDGKIEVTQEEYDMYLSFLRGEEKGNQPLTYNGNTLIVKTQQPVVVKKEEKHAGGRPTVITDEVVRKLEEVAALDGAVLEMCFYAGISKTAYYEYIRANPEFADRIAALRERPVLLARKTVVEGLDKSPTFALSYLDRKRPNEFAPKHKIEHSGNVGMTAGENPEIEKEEEEIALKYEADLKALIGRKRTAEELPAKAQSNEKGGAESGDVRVYDEEGGRQDGPVEAMQNAPGDGSK